ncbi:MAG: LrgB family protein [Lachnospiraceae bacterium]|nr:LrgB family protein [Lachnospiraceae bacterium]
MHDFFSQSVYFGALATFGFYQLGVYLKKKTGLAIMNPILVAAVIIVVLLKVTRTEYADYNAGAKYITYLLTPTTVCLAVPLYEQFELLKKHRVALLTGITSSVIISALLILGFSVLFGLTHEEFVTFLPKSITTAIAMGLSEQLGGYVSITVVAVIITGVFGNIAAEAVLKLFHVTHPIAKGVAIGSSSHAVGTAKAMELGEIEGAMSSLSIAVAGVLTVIASIIFSMIY